MLFLVAAVLCHLPCLLVLAVQLNIHACEAYVGCWGLWNLQVAVFLDLEDCEVKAQEGFLEKKEVKLIAEVQNGRWGL